MMCSDCFSCGGGWWSCYCWWEVGWELGKVVEDALDMLVVVLVFSDARCTGVMGVK